MFQVVAYNVYGDTSEIVISKHRTEAAARKRLAKEERSRDRRIKGGDMASRGERYRIFPRE